MKAVCISRLGQPEVLEIVERERPAPSLGEALVRVSHVGLNWLDILLRTEPLGIVLPHSPGSDVVGIIEGINGDGEGMRIGDVVVVNPAVPCEECKQGCASSSECKFVRIFGVYCPGGYGHFVRVPIQQLHKKPEVLSLEEAAAFPLDYLTAWRMLFTRGRLQSGESVVIWGATGSLGSAAVRLAAWAGAYVIATVGRSEYASAIEMLGANVVLNYKTDDIPQSVFKQTNGRGADLIFESIGAATFSRSIEAVRPHGRIVICGTRAGSVAGVDLSEVYYKQIEILGSRMGTAVEFAKVLTAIGLPELRPVVGKVFSVRDAKRAHEAMENRDFIGKVILKHDWQD